MATTHSDTSVNSLVINKLTKAQYDALETKSETELYLVPDEIDNAPTSGSDNPVKSGGVYTALQDKADKVPNATNGNFAGLDANGNLTDSGSKASDFATTQQLPTTMGASGSGHKGGLVPDTPSTAGTTKFLREDGTWAAPPAAPVTSVNGQTGAVVLSIPDVSTKEDMTTVEAPVDQTDATLPITSLTCEVGKYYRIDVAVDTLNVTLPAMTNVTSIKTVVLYLTGGTTPAVTILSTAPTGGTIPDVYYQDGYAIESGKTYEVNCLWNGAAWIVASVEIVVTNNGGE